MDERLRQRADGMLLGNIELARRQFNDAIQEATMAGLTVEAELVVTEPLLGVAAYQRVNTRVTRGDVEVPLYGVEIACHGSLLPMADWREDVTSGAFTDYDGWGHAVRDGKMTARAYRPSEVAYVPDDASHMLWFNR